MKRFIVATSFFICLTLLLEMVVRLQIWPDAILPAPSAVFLYLSESIRDGVLIKASYVTFKRLAEGYVTGVCVGIPLGLLCAKYQFFEDTLGVVALGLQALPSICWVPLALLWFGQTETAMFFIVVMGSIWSIVLATAAGVKQVPTIYIRAAQTMGSNGLHTWIHVIIPASLPSIVGGMKQGWAFAWRSLMAAEIYITVLTGFGLGYLLHYARELHSMEAVIGIMVVIIFIGLLIDKCFFSPLENYLQERWGIIKIKR